MQIHIFENDWKNDLLVAMAKCRDALFVAEAQAAAGLTDQKAFTAELVEGLWALTVLHADHDRLHAVEDDEERARVVVECLLKGLPALRTRYDLGEICRDAACQMALRRAGGELS